jgi:hypothetical protein
VSAAAVSSIGSDPVMVSGSVAAAAVVVHSRNSVRACSRAAAALYASAPAVAPAPKAEKTSPKSSAVWAVALSWTGITT